MIMFSLNCLYKSSNESGSWNQGNCFLLYKKRRYEVLLQVWKNLYKDEETVTIVSKILFAVFYNLNYEFSIVKMSRGKITELSLSILNYEETSRSNYDIFMKILYYLSIYNGSHKFMIEEGVLGFIYEKLKKLDPKNIDSFQLSEFAQLLKMLRNLFSNRNNWNLMNEKGWINLIIDIYKKDFDINFIRDECLNCFYDISNSDIGVNLLNKYLNFYDLLKNIFQSKSIYLIEKAQKIVINVVKNKDKIKEYLNNINFENLEHIIFLSFISKCEIFYELLDNINLVDKILLNLKKSNDFLECSALLKSLNNILKISESKFKDFIQNDGIIIIKDKLNKKDYFTQIWVLNLIDDIIIYFEKEDFNQLMEQLRDDLYNNYIDLNQELEYFIKEAINMEKSKEAIEYNKDEMNKIIMKNLNYEFKDKKHSITTEIAYNYIYINKIICIINPIFYKLERKTKEINKDHINSIKNEIITTGINSLKAYKIKEVYESVFIGIKSFDLNDEQRLKFKEESLSKLLLESIWKNPGWKYFCYHLIEAYNKILDKKELLPKFRVLNWLSIIASILLFVDEEDLSSLEQINVENNTCFEVLKKSENDHILKIGLNIMNNLLEQDTINVVLKNLKSKMDNLSGTIPKDVVPQLRSEFAILSAANLILIYGCEFIDLKGHSMIDEYHNKLLKMRDFVNKNQLISESIRTVTSLVSITITTKGRELYEKNEISKQSIQTIENIINTKKDPLLNYLSMRPLKLKLLLRIKIIEDAEGFMRKKIYNDNSLLLLNINEQPKIIKNLVSIWLENIRKFKEYRKIKIMAITIIILLCYIFKQYKDEFIGLGLISLGLDMLDEISEEDNLNLKSLELIDELFNDSEEGKQIFIKEDGVNKLICALSKNKNPEFKKLAKQILEKLNGLEFSKNVEEKLWDHLKILKEYSNGNTYPIEEIAETSKIITSYCIIPDMKKILNNNDHIGIIERIIDIENKKNIKDIEENGNFNELKDIIIYNIKALNIQLDNENNLKLIDCNKIIPNLLNLIENYKDIYNKDPLVSGLQALNNLFNKDKGGKIKEEVDNIEYFPKIKELYEKYNQSNNLKLKNEITLLYNNLNKANDSSFSNQLDRILNNILNLQNQPDNNFDDLNDSINNLKNNFNNKEFNSKIDNKKFINIIENNLKLLNFDEDLVDKILKTFNGENLNSKINRDNQIGIAENTYFMINKLLELDGELITNNPKICKDFNNLSILSNLNSNNLNIYTNLMNYLKNNKIENSLINTNDLETIKSLEIIENINLKDNFCFKEEDKSKWFENYSYDKFINYIKLYINSIENLEIDKSDRIKDLIKYSRLVNFYIKNKNIELNEIDNTIKREFINSFSNLLFKTQLQIFDNEVFLDLIDFILYLSQEKDLLKHLKNPKLFNGMLLRFYGTSYELLVKKSGNVNYKESDILNSIKFTLKRNRVINYDLINTNNCKLEIKNEFNIDDDFKDLFEANCYNNFWEYLLTNNDDVEKELVFKRKFEILRELCFNKNLAIKFKNKFSIILNDFMVFENTNEENNRNYVNFIIMETISLLLIVDNEDLEIQENDFDLILNKILNPIITDKSMYYPLLTYKSLDIFKNLYYYSKLKHKFFENDLDDNLINLYELYDKNSIKEIIEQEKNLSFTNIYGNDIFDYIETILMNTSILNMSMNTIEKQLKTILYNNYLLLAICHFNEEPRFNRKFFNHFNKDIFEYCYELINNIDNLKEILENDKKFDGYLTFSSHNTVRFVQLIFYLFSEFTKNINNTKDIKDSKYDYKFLENNLNNTNIDDLSTIKNIESISNLIKSINLEEYKANKDYIDDLNDRILNKHIPFYQDRPDIINKLWNNCLKKIEELKKEYEEKRIPSLLEIIQKLLDNLNNKRKLNEDFKNDLDNLSKYIINFTEILNLNNLNDEEMQALELILDNFKNEKFNDIEIDTIFNLNLTDNFRIMANSPYLNKEMINKLLNLLLEYCSRSFTNMLYVKNGFNFGYNFLNTDYILYIQDQSKNYDESHTNKNILNDFKSNENILIELSIMNKITLIENGAINALSIEHIDIFNIIFDLILNYENKINEWSLSILINLMEHISESNVKLIYDLIKKLISKKFNKNTSNNEDLYKFFCLMIKLIGNISEKKLSIREELVDIGSLEFITIGNDLFPQREELILNTSATIYKLLNESLKNIKSVIDSKILYFIAEYLKNLEINSWIPLYVCKLILKLTYKNWENKSKIGEFGFIDRLVPLLIYHSHPDRINYELCLLILKCIANLTHLSQNCEIIIKDGLIPCYFNFFNNYKEKFDHMKILLFTIGNLCYEFNEFIIKEILKDNVLQLFNNCFNYYNQINNIDLLLIGIDSLSNITHTQEICKALHYTNINESLCDFIKFQIYEKKLMIKTLKCLSRFSFDDEMCNKIIDHNGHIYIMNLINKYNTLDEIVYNSYKLLYILSHKENIENLKKMYNDGLPEDILENYNTEWKTPIILYSYKLFTKMAKINEVKELLIENFLIKLINKLKTNIDKDLLINGLELLNKLSELSISCEHILFFDGHKALDNVLNEYKGNVKIVLLVSQIMENMLLNDNSLSKPKFREIYTHVKIDKEIEIVNKVEETDLLEILNRVKELLKEEEELSDEDDKESIDSQENKEDLIKKKIPPEISQFLIHGKLLTVYLEDGKKRYMYMFVSKDFRFLKLKYPKENIIKQKYILKIHQIKEIKKGYTKSSPLAKSGGFFSSAPKKEICLVIYGPQSLVGAQNYHIKCKNPYEANKWIECLNYLLEGHKKTQLKGLKN